MTKGGGEEALGTEVRGGQQRGPGPEVARGRENGQQEKQGQDEFRGTGRSRWARGVETILKLSGKQIRQGRALSATLQAKSLVP